MHLPTSTKTQIRFMHMLAAVTSVLMLFGCASGPQVRAEYDKKADFTQYKTFGFASPLGTDRSGYQTQISQYLKNATRRELEARGLQYVETSPQLIVNFNAKLAESLRVDSVPVSGYGYYGYRGGYYSAWPAYSTDVSTYTEGTLNIDVVDLARKQMVWEGVAVGTVTQKKLDKLEESVNKAVAATLKKFPITPPAAAK